MFYISSSSIRLVSLESFDRLLIALNVFAVDIDALNLEQPGTILKENEKLLEFEMLSYLNCNFPYKCTIRKDPP